MQRRSWPVLTCAFFTLLLFGTAPALGKVTGGVPDEFRDLLSAEEREQPPALTDGFAYVELFVDGRRFGDVVVQQSVDAVRLDDPQVVIARLQHLQRVEELIERLQGPGAVCVQRVNQPCAPASPGQTTFAYDPLTPRLDIFTSPRYRPAAPALTPTHRGEPGVLTDLVLRGAGRLNDSASARGTAAVNVIAGLGPTSVFAETLLGFDGSQRVRRAGFARYFDRHRLAGGVLQTPFSDHFAQVEVIGLEWGTALEALSPVAAEEPPLVIFLGEDSQVEVRRDGELLYARFHRAGVVNLPTRELPFGSYVVDVTIRGQSGAERIEQRLLSHTGARLQPGTSRFLIQAGKTRERIFANLQPGTEDVPYLSFVFNRTSYGGTPLQSRLGLVDDVAFAEAATERLRGNTLTRLSAMLTQDGGYSALGSVSAPIGRLRLHARVRHADFRSFAALIGSRDRAFTEADLNASMSLGAGGSINVFARTRNTDRADRRTAWGISWQRPLNWFGRRWPGRLNVSFQDTPFGRRAQVQLRFSHRQSRSSRALQFAHFTSRAADGTRAQSFGGTFQSDWWSRRGAPSPWGLSLRGDWRDDGDHRLAARSSLRNDALDMDWNFDHSFADAGSTLWSGAVSTSIALTRSGVAMSSERSSGGALLLDARELSGAGQLEHTLNRRNRQPLERRLQYQPLHAFRSYDLSIRPTRSAPAGLVTANVRVVPFPGNIIRIVPALRRQQTVFGRVVSADGQPLRVRLMSDEGEPYVTDTDGYFVLDVPHDTQSLEAETSSGRCTLQLPPLPDETMAYVDIGDLQCADSLE